MKLGMVDGDVTRQHLSSDPPALTQTRRQLAFYKHPALEEFLSFSESFFNLHVNI